LKKTTVEGGATVTQYQITLSNDLVHGLFKEDGAMARLLEQVLDQVLQAQVTEALQAKPFERTEERQGYRNGFKPRTMTTRVGRLVLSVPQVRDGKFSPELFSRFQRSEQALVLALIEMVVNGVSTRKVAKVTEELCGTEFSKSMVSELCKRLDPLVKGWNERPFSQAYPFIVVDAVVLKVRKDGQVRSQSALIAIGVNINGYREVLGFRIGDSETYASWCDFFAWLKGRGLRGVDLVVSDHHGGLVKAVETQFQGAMWQRCQTHFTCNVLDACPKRLRDELHAQLRVIWEAPDMETARQMLQRVIESFCGRAPRAVNVLEEGFDDAVAVLSLPGEYRKRLRTTNGIERLNEEVRRRERVIRIFPNGDSAERLLGALLMEQDETWSTGRLYFDMRAYLEWNQRQQTQAIIDVAGTAVAGS
jgi:transposase-like protein